MDCKYLEFCIQIYRFKLNYLTSYNLKSLTSFLLFNSSQVFHNKLWIATLKRSTAANEGHLILFNLHLHHLVAHTLRQLRTYFRYRIKQQQLCFQLLAVGSHSHPQDSGSYFPRGGNCSIQPSICLMMGSTYAELQWGIPSGYFPY